MAEGPDGVFPRLPSGPQAGASAAKAAGGGGGGAVFSSTPACRTRKPEGEGGGGTFNKYVYLLLVRHQLPAVAAGSEGMLKNLPERTQAQERT